MIELIKRIILLFWIFCLPVQAVFSQLYSSKDNYTGTWETPASWNPTWTAPQTANLSGYNFTINGYITVNGSLSFSGTASNLIINDTLVIKGNLLLENNTTITVNDNGILIVRGNLTISNQAIIIANGYLIIAGDIIKNGSDLQGPFTSNDDPVKLFVGGIISPVELTDNYPNFPVLNCTAQITTPYPNSTCSYGDMTDIINDPIYPFFQSTCTITNVNSNSPVCTGNTINLTSSGGTGYSWSGPNGFTSSAQNPSIPYADTAMTGAYIVTVTATTGCTVADTTEVIINPLLPVSVSVAPSVNPVCAGTSVTFTATPTNGGSSPTYQWQLNGSNVGTNNTTYTNSEMVTGDIVTCNITSSDTCITTATDTSNAITMVVYPLTGANVTGCTVVCSGGTVTLSGNPSGGTPSYTHVWDVSTPGLINLINNNDGTATITAAGTESAAGTYTVTDSYGCVTTALFNIAVNQQPGAIRVNTGTPSALIASAIASRWQGFTSSGVNSALYLGYSRLGGGGERSELGIVNYLHPGNNTISFTYDKWEDKLTASINGSQVVYNNVASQVNIFSLGKASVDGMNYLSVYMRNTSTGSISLNNLVLNGISLSSFNGSGSDFINWWTITGLDFGLGFTLTGTITLDEGTYGINDESQVEFNLGEKIDFACISIDPAVCSEQPATVYLSGLIKNRTYSATYSIDGEAVVTSSSFTSDVNGNGSFQTVNLMNSTSVPVTQTIVMTSLNCGSASLTVNCNNSRQVVVNSAFPISVSISAAANHICEGTSVSFTATPANGGTTPSYQWKVNGANVGTNSAIYTYAPANNDTVTCVLTSSNSTCATGSSATSNTVIMAVNELPIATAGSNIPVCAGNTISLKSSGGTDYTWSGPNDFTISKQNPSISDADNSMSGIYTVTVTALNGCTNTAITEVTVIELPLVNITSSSSSMCINDLRTLTASPAGGTFIITDGPGNITGNVLSATGTGNINLEYNYTNVCANKATQSIIVNENPVAIAGPEQKLKFVYETEMKAELSSSEGEWSLISGSGHISDIYSPTTRITELSGGENIFLWKVWNGNCKASAEVKITVYDPFIPSVITPDGDGKNDYFKIDEFNGQVELIIFNRWGNEEYTNRNYSNDWDGRNNKGVELPNDTYFYILKFENVKIKKGSVLIKR